MRASRKAEPVALLAGQTETAFWISEIKRSERADQTARSEAGTGEPKS
jgi:hypothetical protein